jgi:ferredoxin-NADP reductase
VTEPTQSPDQPKRLAWSIAEVVAVKPETPRVKSLTLAVPDWPGHRAGQHVDVRLTAEDGYQAQRSYSIASPPGAAHLELIVEIIEDGEVSPYLGEEVRPGDRFELRGPIGGYFVWTPDQAAPLVLIAGGSGIAPLMSMLRLRAQGESRPQTTLLYSSRGLVDIIYREELDRLAEADDSLRILHTLTRSQPVGWGGFARRIDAAMLAEIGISGLAAPNIFICGPTGMVEGAASSLVALGVAAVRIKTERFGPSG